MNQGYTTNFMINQTPEEAFAAIMNVRGWWSQEIEGDTDKLGAVFNYHFQDLHRCTMKITELVPDKKIVWLVQDNYFSFTKDSSEWKGTEVIFEIARKGGQTEVVFTHKGLVPEYECYDACVNGWSTYISGSLHDLITQGRGQPNIGQPITTSEQRLVS